MLLRQIHIVSFCVAVTIVSACNSNKSNCKKKTHQCGLLYLFPARGFLCSLALFSKND